MLMIGFASTSYAADRQSWLECRETVAYLPGDFFWNLWQQGLKFTARSKSLHGVAASSSSARSIRASVFHRRLPIANWDAFRASMRRGGGGGGQPNRSESSDVSSSSSVHLTPPAITFGNLIKSHIDANFTLSATSDSPGAITYTSGDSGLVTISGTTADIVGTYGTVTITANQAASGNYAAGSAAMTLTVFYTYCLVSPCINGGVCVPTLQGALTDDNYVCECPDHYSGSNCFMSDLNCQENGGDLFCFNSGNCIPSEDGGECDCVNGFCGAQCTVLPSQCH